MKISHWKNQVQTSPNYSVARCENILEKTPQIVENIGLGQSTHFIWSKGIDWHTDPIVPRWNAFLVLYAPNCTLAFRKAKYPLNPGDIILWSPHDEHRLEAPIKACDSHGLVVIFVEYDKKPRKSEVVFDLLKLYLERTDFGKL